MPKQSPENRQGDDTNHFWEVAYQHLRPRKEYHGVFRVWDDPSVEAQPLAGLQFSALLLKGAGVVLIHRKDVEEEVSDFQATSWAVPLQIGTDGYFAPPDSPGVGNWGTIPCELQP